MHQLLPIECEWIPYKAISKGAVVETSNGLVTTFLERIVWIPAKVSVLTESDFLRCLEVEREAAVQLSKQKSLSGGWLRPDAVEDASLFRSLY